MSRRPPISDLSNWHGKPISKQFKHTTKDSLMRCATSLNLSTTGNKAAVWLRITTKVDKIYQAQGWTEKYIWSCIRNGEPYVVRQAPGLPSKTTQEPQAGSPGNAHSQDSSSSASAEDFNHRRPPQSPARSSQQSNSSRQFLETNRSARRHSDSRSSQETENETSVEFYPREKCAPSPVLPAQQAFDRVELRKIILAAAHQPFHVPLAPKVVYREHPGRMTARKFASAFNGRDHPGISALRIIFQEHQAYRVASEGILYPWRGRGPIWANNSCAFDCVLVAAQLLQVGLSPIDHGNRSRRAWLRTLTPNRRDFLEAAADPMWDVWTREQSIAKRDRLFDQTIQDCNTLAGVNNQLKRGNLMAATTLWNHHMSSLAQFGFGISRTSICTHCQEVIEIPRFQQQATLTPDQRAGDEKMSMQELLQQHFSFKPRKKVGKKHCVEGSTLVTGRIVQDTLPTRLIVYAPSNNRNVPQATSDMTFKYRSITAKADLSVTYRWLGGIYRYENHYRVYFTDVPYGAQDDYLQIYDGNAAEAVIIDEVLPEEPDNRVPRNWAQYTDILFYEKVNLDNLQAVVKDVLSGYLDLNDSGTEDDLDAEGERDDDNGTGNYRNFDPTNTTADEEGNNNDDNQHEEVDVSKTKQQLRSKKSNRSDRSPTKKASISETIDDAPDADLPTTRAFRGASAKSNASNRSSGSEESSEQPTTAKGKRPMTGGKGPHKTYAVKKIPEKNFPIKGPAKKTTPLPLSLPENEEGGKNKDYPNDETSNDQVSSDESEEDPLTSNRATQMSKGLFSVSMCKRKRGHLSRTSTSNDEWSITLSPPKKKKWEVKESSLWGLFERKKLPDGEAGKIC